MDPIARLKILLIKLVWAVDTTGWPWWQAWPLTVVRLTYAAIRDLADGMISLRAMSLVYTTLLSLVPLLAISFSVLKGFGVHSQLEPLLLGLLAPLGEKGVEIASQIIQFVDNIKVGVLGSLGLGLLFFTVISLMQKIERAFNDIWQVSRDRSFFKRFSDYLSVLVVGPALVFSSLGLKASVMSNAIVGRVIAFAPFGIAIDVAGQLLPYCLIIVAFTFIYVFIPNTRVKFTSALVGALIAGLLWQTVGWAFASYVVSSAQYSAIYSAFATLVLFMIWLYVAWLILLIGASIAFYHQHPEFMRLRRGELQLSARFRERLALLIAGGIARNFVRGRPPRTVEGLSGELGVPVHAVEQVTASLERGGLVLRTLGAPPGFVPARPLGTIQLKDVLDAVRSDHEPEEGRLREAEADPAIDRIVNLVDRATAEALAGRTLEDLAWAEAGPGEARAERGGVVPLRPEAAADGR